MVPPSALFLLWPALLQDTAPAHPSLQRVLVYTLSAGFEHDVVKRPEGGGLSLVEQALVDLGRESGRFEAVPSRDASEFDRQRLARYDAVLFYTTGELPLSEAQRRSLLDFVKDGRAFVGVHCATDTFYQVPEYGEMVGAYFDGHPWHEAVRVRVEDQGHAATRHLGAAFEIVDEIYQNKAPYDRAKLHVLLSLDPDAVDLARPAVHRKDRDFALAWTREFGQGRVFYTGLGHRPEVWKDERFRRHLLGGLRWVLRDDPARKPEHEALRAWLRDHPGDPARGSAVFRREGGPLCTRCHSVNGQGGAVGPELSDLARKRTREEILVQILDPSDEIAPGFRATAFELKDGTQVLGRVRSETAGRIELWDADGRLRALDPRDVATRRESARSVMPEGLEAKLAREDLADLLAWPATLKGS